MDAGSSSERERLIAEIRRFNAALRSPRMHRAGPLMDLDLTISQLKVVFLLAEEGPMRMSPLAQQLGITLSACTHLVDKLVRGDLVVRSEDPHDRRVVLCVLTDKGMAMGERLRQSLPFERREFLDRLTINELRVIVQAMGIFRRVMAEMQAEQAPSVGADSRQPMSGD